MTPLWCDRDSTQDITIRDTVVWERIMYLRGNLYIEAGGSLSIRCLASMPAGSHIYIAPGGKLLLEGGTLYQSCGREWQGIIIGSSGDKAGVFEYTDDAVVRDVFLDDSVR
ncbi:MAG: hypothetical protein R2795_23780 [Saprospiraceae bacterium]